MLRGFTAYCSESLIFVTKSIFRIPIQNTKIGLFIGFSVVTRIRGIEIRNKVYANNEIRW